MEFLSRGTAAALFGIAVGVIVYLPPGGGVAAANVDAPFAGLAGRWTGEGRLGFKEGKSEKVTCRATYFVAENAQDLTQNIRCASTGGKVEVKSTVTHQDGKLTGSWNELVYNVSGELSGEITKAGYKVSVRSTDLTANMEIVLRETTQVVEIQFHHASLVGLTLLLEKG